MAAAYAALVSLFNNLELIQNHHRFSFSFENIQIQSLAQSVCFLIDFMETCDHHQGSKEAAQVLERQIASAAHAANDVVESHVVDQIHDRSTLDAKTRSVYLLDLQKVIQNLDFVTRKAMKVKKAPTRVNDELMATSSKPLTHEKIRMVGFDEVMDQLMDMLTDGHSSRRVIPIVGMGGVGKTTLARNTFEHKLIMQHFDVRLWATISQNYSVRGILALLLSSQGKSSVNELGEELHKTLYGRRYLIVLDDVWSVDVWDKIQIFLPENGNRSRVVLTTRQWNLANIFWLSCLKMNVLNEDESWNLFCEKTFPGQGCPPQLIHVGKKIVEKCKGLPLAIIVVGGHLRKSSIMQEYWEEVANNLNSIFLDSEENEQCLDILSLSYRYLPVRLKPCFLYMGTFQEDEVIHVSRLLQLWIAEGFIKSKKALNSSEEEVAEDYLKDLIERNLIMPHSQNFTGKITACKVHDILRELCLKIAVEEKFYHVVDTSPQAILMDSRIVINENFGAPTSAPLVRSLKGKGCQLSFYLRLLRVQNRVGRASGNEVDQGFLEANFNHVNLRYLYYSTDDIYDDFEGARYFYLPSAISLLWNLQTVVIRGAYHIIAPYEIWEMPQLRHLEFNEIFLPDPPPSHKFEPSNELGWRSLLTVANFKLSEEVCKRISNMKELGVAYYHFGEVFEEPRSYYSPQNVGLLHELESFDCSLSQGPEWGEFASSLTFPTSLKKLCLTALQLHWEELTMTVGFLPNLEDLNLHEVEGGEEWNPLEGGFSHLRSLSLSDCPNLVYWNADNSHFPVLECLFLEDLSKLDEFPSDFGDIPTLQLVSLSGCSESLAMSAMRMVVEQEEEHGNEDILLDVDFCGDRKKLDSFMKMVQEEGLTSDSLVL